MLFLNQKVPVVNKEKGEVLTSPDKVYAIALREDCEIAFPRLTLLPAAEPAPWAV